MQFSASLIKDWMDCPLQAKFKRIDKLPKRQSAKASFGTIIHAALEHFNRSGDLDASIALFHHFWSNPEEMNVEPDYYPRYMNHGSLRARGVEILREYADKQKWETRRIVSLEHKFLVPFGEHTLMGYIDLMEVKKSSRGVEELRLIDFKTASRKPSLAQLALDVQFTVYDYASWQPEFWLGNGDGFPPVPNGEWWSEMLAGTPRQNIWYHLMTNQELKCGARAGADYERLYRVCTEIVRAIEAQIFVPTISGDSCSYCDFATTECPMTVPLRLRAQDEDQEQLEESVV